ncbi:deoxyribose-phosphate aldolase [Pseudonocardia spinosispora]|uniref:deoxyribose-phosphate aldolase n=1 Tax=Pseudonocardia spinosispora TaxID=103441 RepID=UPI0003F92DF5|nr:deoxyribose-phosphate aldolase [Pseudonocardia spinosispora]
MASALASLIDHTLLKPEATADEVGRLCTEAVTHEFKAVCVNPYWVPRAAELLANSSVALCAVASFPFGCSRTEAKSAEAALAVREGADEVDMVINLGALKSGELDVVEADIRAVRDATAGRVLKVIIEAAALEADELVSVVELCAAAEVDFVKTSTGYHAAGGARVADVVAIKKALDGREIGIKASGGIRDYAFALALIEAGATRLGASSGVSLVKAEAAAQ